MTSPEDRYRGPVQRDSTLRRFQGVWRHFEQEWGGRLPASSEMTVRYLAELAQSPASNTLDLHLAALAQWHLSRSFDDPTKSTQVRQVLRNIRGQQSRLSLYHWRSWSSAWRRCSSASAASTWLCACGLRGIRR